MSTQYEYEIESDGGLEYVVVKCPQGHWSARLDLYQLKS
jgi:hypothetical protein